MFNDKKKKTNFILHFSFYENTLLLQKRNIRRHTKKKNSSRCLLAKFIEQVRHRTTSTYLHPYH